MNASTRAVTLKELQTLEPMAGVTFALRCAERVAPWLHGKYQSEVSVAVRLAKQLVLGNGSLDFDPSLADMQRAAGSLGGGKTDEGRIALTVYLTVLAARAAIRNEPLADLAFSAGDFARQAAVERDDEERFLTACRSDFDALAQGAAGTHADVASSPLW